MMEMTCRPRLGGARPKGGRGSSESSADSVIFSMSLPKEIIERITAGVDLCYHLVEITAKLVDTYFLSS